MLLRLRRPAPAVEVAPERFASAIRAGQRYVRHSPAVRRMLLRAGLFVDLPGAALWALLPLVASRNPCHLRALVHQRDGGDRQGAAAHDP